MWFRGMITKIALVILITIPISGCLDSEKKSPIITSFDFNGELFAYSSPMYNDLQKVYILNKAGDVVRIIEDPEKSIGHAKFGSNTLYYVEYNDAQKESIIKKCDLEFSACADVYKMTGSIRHMLELDNKSLLFIRSRYVPDTHKDSGYAAFNFYRYNHISDKLDYLVGREFMSGGPLYNLGGKIHYSAYFGGSSFHITKDREVQSREDYYFNTGDKKANEYRNDNRLGGGYSLLQNIIYNKYNVYYIGDSSKGNYIYKTCIRKITDFRNCNISTVPTTRPAIHDGHVYYGIWNIEKDKLEITKFNLGEE